MSTMRRRPHLDDRDVLVVTWVDEQDVKKPRVDRQKSASPSRSAEAPRRSRSHLPNKRRGLRAKLIFSAIPILHVQSRVCVQWLGRGGGAQIMESVVLCAANGQDGANAVAQPPCGCNYMSRSLPGFSRREGPSAVPTAWVCAAGVQRVRSRPAWRLALTSESRADIAGFVISIPVGSLGGGSRSVW